MTSCSLGVTDVQEQQAAYIFRLSVIKGRGHLKPEEGDHKLSTISTTICQSTWHHALKDSTLHQPHCDIFKPYKAKGIISFMFMDLTTVSVAHIE